MTAADKPLPTLDFRPRADITRREQAIAAAAHVFARHGYHGAGMRAIADVLGMKVASLYFYFRSKDEALEEVCRAGMEEPLVILRTALDTQTAFDRRIHQFLTDYNVHLGTDSDFISVYLNERRYLLPEAAARLATAARQANSLFDRLFEDAKKEGAMDSAMPLRMARLILISALRNITQFRLEEPIADFDNFVRYSGDHFLRGMTPV